MQVDTDSGLISSNYCDFPVLATEATTISAGFSSDPHTCFFTTNPA